ncbi:Ig-like domain-containing protein [Flavobacterium magnum]|nr:Ig-like domain-containing protein [Flavobacterium magnum]
MAAAVIGCAKRGTITGGPKDTLSPVLQRSEPENGTVNFNAKNIRLYFDEYVKLKDVSKQLVVSPPMNSAPDITPTVASKFINIRITDTLKPNTTYSLNFGQSIQDNNEGNPYPQFRYVFSTGSYIDSLKIEGSIKDALETKTDNFVNVMLYEMDETFNDSVIYKAKPRYVTNTLDSLTSFQIENIKAGKYLLIALKDNVANYKFDPKKDKIAFYPEPVVLPSDRKYNLQLFSEVPIFKAQKPTQAAGGRLLMGYEGSPAGVNATVKNGNEIIPSVVTRFPEKDSVQIWFKPIKADSITVHVDKDKFMKDFVVRLKNQKVDSLAVTPSNTGTLHPRQQFSLRLSVPLATTDTTKISVTDLNNKPVPYKTAYDSFEQRLNFGFRRDEEQKYKVTLLPGALTDLYDHANDTLSYTLSTRKLSEYGNLMINLKGVKQFPVIVQLTDGKGKVFAEEYAENSPLVEFIGLEPNKFTLRVIYDTNKNRYWDTGDFLERRLPEEVIYFAEPLEVRSNWDVTEDVDLGG